MVNSFSAINYFVNYNVSSTSFADAGGRIPFNTTNFAILVETTNSADIIEYSFDGLTIAGDINPQFILGAIFDDRTIDKIFFRRQSPGGSVLVRFEAWANP